MNLGELGGLSAQEARVSPDVRRAIARATGLSEAAVRGRLSRAHGRSLVRNVLGSRWVPRLDELGDMSVGQLDDQILREISRTLGLTLPTIRSELANAGARRKVRTALAGRWPKLSELSRDAILDRSLASLARLGTVEEIARVLGTEPQALARRFARGHGRADARGALADLLPSAPASARTKTKRSLLLDRFEVEDAVLSGGMGRVKVAIDHWMAPPRKVVLKWAHPGQKHLADALLRELDKAKDLAHPGLVKYHGRFDDDDGATFLELEYGGVDLRTRLRENGALNWDEALVIVRQVADALDYLHGEGIVHLDVSPANVVIDGNGSARLTDFGISRRLAGGGTSKLTSTITSWHSVFSAPEVSRMNDADASADQYSLALVFLTCVHGYERFVEVHERGERAELTREPRFAALRRALDRTPEKRFSSVGEFVDTLANEGAAKGWLEKFANAVFG